MELTLNDTQLKKLADLYNANDKKDGIYFCRMLEARQEGNTVEALRMERFRQVTEARERAYDEILKILGLCATTDEDDPEGWYKIVKK